MSKKKDRNYSRELGGVDSRESKAKKEKKEKCIPEPYHTEERILTPEDLKESKWEWGPDIAMEPAPSYVMIPKKQGEFTVEDYYALPDDYRCELIDGVIYDMGAPKLIHQYFIGQIYRRLDEYIEKKQGKCMAGISPIDVRLDRDNRTMVQPDVLVLCKREQLLEWGIEGAPDLVIEVLSKSTAKKDRIIKLRKYREAGVREYWMIDTYAQRVVVYQFGEQEESRIYGFETEVPVGIFDGECRIDVGQIYGKISFVNQNEEREKNR